MEFALVIILGLALVLFVPGNTTVLLAFGAIAGLLLILAEAKWPKPEPTYVKPTVRPKSAKPASSYVAAAVMVVISGVFAIFAWKVAMPRFPLGGAYGIYMAAAGIGMAVGVIATAKRFAERHNAWIASMTPQAPLDF